MKNFKIVLSIMLLFAVGIGFSAFTSKGTSHTYNAKAFSNVSFDYVSGDITDPSNWGEGSTSFCTGGHHLCGITFDNTLLDGDGNPNSDVLGAVAAHWQDTPGSDGTVIIIVDGKTVIIYLKP
jgi:hypothetical protein